MQWLVPPRVPISRPAFGRRDRRRPLIPPNLDDVVRRCPDDAETIAFPPVTSTAGPNIVPPIENPVWVKVLRPKMVDLIGRGILTIHTAIRPAAHGTQNTSHHTKCRICRAVPRFEEPLPFLQSLRQRTDQYSPWLGNRAGRLDISQKGGDYGCESRRGLGRCCGRKSSTKIFLLSLFSR